jgi:DNA-directed RNA polymerase specialized sigma24 family protein
MNKIRAQARAVLKEEELAGLVERSRGGDEDAWAALWLALAPVVEDVARRGRVTGRLSRCPDGRRDIVVQVMGALRGDGFRILAELGERLACRDGSFRGWLSTMARNAAVSHVRAHPEYLGTVPGRAGRWARHVPIPASLEDERPPMSRQIEVRRIVARCPDVLEPAQLDALSGWLRGDDFAEIAVALHLDGGAGAAERLVRSALERLRARFAATTRRRRAASGGPSSRARDRGRSVANGRTAHRAGSRKIDGSA